MDDELLPDTRATVERAIEGRGAATAVVDVFGNSALLVSGGRIDVTVPRPGHRAVI